MNDMNDYQPKGDTGGLTVDVSNSILTIIEMSENVTFDNNGLPTFPISIFAKLKNWNQPSITKLQELIQNNTTLSTLSTKTAVHWIQVIEGYLNFLKTGK